MNIFPHVKHFEKFFFFFVTKDVNFDAGRNTMDQHAYRYAFCASRTKQLEFTKEGEEMGKDGKSDQCEVVMTKESLAKYVFFFFSTRL